MKVLCVIDMQNDFIDGALGTAEAVAIAEDVREALEESVIEHLDYTVSETMLVSATEGYDLDTDTYVEALQFSIKIS